MTPPLTPLWLAAKWLWDKLEGPKALRVTRICVFVTALSAVVLTYSVVGLYALVSSMTASRDKQISDMNLTLARVADAITVLKDVSARQQADVFDLTSRVAHAEGRLDAVSARAVR